MPRKETTVTSMGAGPAALAIVAVILAAFTHITESMGRLTSDVRMIILVISGGVLLILIKSKIKHHIQRKRVRQSISVWEDGSGE